MGHSDSNDCKCLKDECLISMKVYDECRQQDCLTPPILGNARSNEQFVAVIGNPPSTSTTTVTPGTVITLPPEAATVKIVDGSFSLAQINIISIEPRRFTNDGYWDITIEFVFNYQLQFLTTASQILDVTLQTGVNPTVQTYINATSSYTKKVTLFGSIGSDLVIASNIFNPPSNILSYKPYVWVEASAMPLEEDLVTIDAFSAVNVTIGLFTIIKLFRLVNLKVKSTGFSKPKPCTEISSDPCKFFSSLDFPFDLFNPPQKEDFTSSSSSSSSCDTSSSSSSYYDNSCNYDTSSSSSSGYGCNCDSGSSSSSGSSSCKSSSSNSSSYCDCDTD